MRLKKYLVKSKRISIETDLTQFRADFFREVEEIQNEINQEMMKVFERAHNRMWANIYETEETHLIHDSKIKDHDKRLDHLEQKSA